MFISIFQDYKKICQNIEMHKISVSHKKKLSLLEKFVLVLEDRRFYYHPGFDLYSIFRVTLRRIQKQKITGGASTIEQQFVRTITDRREYKISRKIREIFLSILISMKYEKNLILRTYLEIAYTGYNLIGVQQASQFYYRVTPQNLNFKQAAHIASLLKYPMPKSVSKKWEEKINKRSLYARFILKVKMSASVKLIRNM